MATYSHDANTVKRSALQKPSRFCSRATHVAQRGFTLIELMVGIVVGLIVIGGAIAVYLMVLTGSTHAIREARLNQELRVAVAFMTEDIRRAGFWRDAANLDFGSSAMPDHPNFFARRNANGTPITDIAIHNDCLVFSYDATYEGAEGQTVFGYRVAGGAIQMLMDDTVTTTNACPANNAIWADLTNPDVVVITGLSFDTVGSRCFNGSYDGSDPDTELEWEAPPSSSEPACATPPPGQPQDGDLLVESRRINITVEGHHTNDASTNHQIGTTVKVRNNRVYRHRAT